MHKTLFVCSGNTCRSPMAEGYFNYLVTENHLQEKFLAVSAGLHAFEGSPANERSRIVVSQDKIDLTGHLSSPVTSELLKESNLILTMTREHKRETLERFPECKDKIFTLKEFTDQKGDILDPIGLGEHTYESTYREIQHDVKLAFEKIIQEKG